MFAGHLLLVLFVLGGDYMLFVADSISLKLLSPFAFGMAIVFTFFEAFVQVVQAYIFVMLDGVLHRLRHRRRPLTSLPDPAPPFAASRGHPERTHRQ